MNISIALNRIVGRELRGLEAAMFGALFAARSIDCCHGTQGICGRHSTALVARMQL